MGKDSIQTAVAGASGYAGLELARLLLHHPRLQGRPPVFVGRDAEPVRLTEMHPQLADNNGSSGLLVETFSWELLQERGVELRTKVAALGSSCGLHGRRRHGSGSYGRNCFWRRRRSSDARNRFLN